MGRAWREGLGVPVPGTAPKEEVDGELSSSFRL